MVNLFFDVDDTLYDQLQPFKRAFQEEISSGKDIPYEEIYKRSRYYSDQVFGDVEAGRMCMEDMYRYRISKALDDYGIRIQGEQAALFQKAYAGYQKEIELLPEMKAVLDCCKESAGVTGIITNGPADHQSDKIRRLCLEQWIDRRYIFISGEIKLAKPDVRLFHLIQKNVHLEPESTYYVGDSFCNDVAGAKRAGWKAIWVNRRKHEIPEGTDLTPDYVTGHERGDLWELVRELVKREL